MNFFQRQQQARRSTRWLVAMFLAAVAAVVVAVNLVVIVALFGFSEAQLPAAETLRACALWTTVITVGVVAVASLYRLAGLSSGGRAVAEGLGAVPVPEETGDFQLRRLRNVVEEMAIASGTPVPAIYLLEDERAINAFAAGWSPADAAVAVTRGALDQLSRDELQGVIAHEFSHVLNGDMRLNIRLMGLLFGILAIALIGEKILRSMRNTSGRRGGGQIALIGIGLFVVGYVGVFFGKVIQAAVSRHRERLADASAVQFTRQAGGIAGALKKIAGLPAGSRLETAGAREVGHMLFGEGVSAWLLATHPPIEERIRALDPSFRLEDYRQALAAQPDATPAGKVPDDSGAAAAFAAGPAPAAAPAGAALSAPAVVAMAGTVQPDHIRQAARLRQALPAPLLAAARLRSDAPAVLFALLLDAGDETRARQVAILRREWPHGVAERAAALWEEARSLEALQRMPLAVLTVPALKHRAREELEQLRTTVRALVHADGRVHVFEYALGAMLNAQLADALAPPARRARAGVKLDRVRDEVRLVLSVLAQVGHPDRGAAAASFLRGLQRLSPRESATPAVPADWADRLDAALAQLDLLPPLGKQQLVEAMVETLLHDGRVTVEEFEILRTVCAVLHCPLPVLARS